NKGIVTLQYPFETLPIPDNGRYRLYNEIEDCIVCDKCAKICPVNCIDIEAIKATEEIGKTSDGTPKRLYAAKFDIDMAKCCYCGLCTTVCPTECLTMTKVYDYSEEKVEDMNYHFSDLSPEEALEKMNLLELFLKEKEEAKKKAAAEKKTATTSPTTKKKLVFKPKVKKSEAREEQVANKEQQTTEETANKVVKAKPKFRPKVKTKTTEEEKKATDISS
ncbi:MAG: 4Fe-4S dicluster domain-containing protein, partial [Bacteroidota bacterium]